MFSKLNNTFPSSSIYYSLYFTALQASILVSLDPIYTVQFVVCYFDKLYVLKTPSKLVVGDSKTDFKTRATGQFESTRENRVKQPLFYLASVLFLATV